MTKEATPIGGSVSMVESVFFMNLNAPWIQIHGIGLLWDYISWKMYSAQLNYSPTYVTIWLYVSNSETRLIWLLSFIIGGSKWSIVSSDHRILLFAIDLLTVSSSRYSFSRDIFIRGTLDGLFDIQYIPSVCNFVYRWASVQLPPAWISQLTINIADCSKFVF